MLYLAARKSLSIDEMAYDRPWRPGRSTTVLAAIALALQIPDVITAVDRSGGPTSHRNFVENYNTPVVIPIKSILTEARQRRLLPKGAKIVANEFAAGGAPAMDEVMFGPPGELYCECTAASPYVLASFIRYTNLNAITRPRFGPYEFSTAAGVNKCRRGRPVSPN